MEEAVWNERLDLLLLGLDAWLDKDVWTIWTGRLGVGRLDER